MQRSLTVGKVSFPSFGRTPCDRVLTEASVQSDFFLYEVRTQNKEGRGDSVTGQELKANTGQARRWTGLLGLPMRPCAVYVALTDPQAHMGRPSRLRFGPPNCETLDQPRHQTLDGSVGSPKTVPCHSPDLRDCWAGVVHPHVDLAPASLICPLRVPLWRVPQRGGRKERLA